MPEKPENYDEIKEAVEVKCPSCNKQLIAFNSNWYEGDLQSRSMLYFPVKKHSGCMGLIDLGMPPTTANIWNLTHIPDDMLYLSMHIFFSFGPGSPEKREDNSWVQINSKGECNRDVRLTPSQASDYFMTLYGWSKGNTDSKCFSICGNASCDFECEPGFVNGVDIENRPKNCPFAIVYDPMSRKWCDCYTVMCEGICFYDLLDVFTEEDKDPNEDFRFQVWLGCMLGFVHKFVGV